MSEGDRRNAIEHSQKEQQKEDFYSRRTLIREKIDKCSRAISRGERRHYEYVSYTLDRSLIPAVRRHVGRPLEDFDSELADHPLWNYQELTKFLERPGHYCELLSEGPRRSGVEALALHTQGFASEETSARTVVARALQSVAAIAENQEIIQDELRNRADAVGFTVKVGEHLQDWSMDLGDPVRVNTDQAGTLKTLFAGGTGAGKSTGLESEGVEDFYQQNFREGRDYKILDVVGLRDGENWFYDIPQQDPTLRRKREDQGLAPDFTEDDELGAPEIEILVPLAPGLSERELPYWIEGDRFVVRPFTIPASELSKPLLVSLILSRLSSEEESLIRQAYDDVDRSIDDWSLRDLADEINDRDEISPKSRKKAVGVLRSLQNEGFIRTKSSEYTLEWRELFEDTDRITVFSQALLDDEVARLVVVAYLLETIARKRERMHGLPECVVIARELWKIAGHKNRQGYDERARSLKEVIGWILTGAFRENRHMGLHFYADTQQVSDLLVSVREMFNRYVLFQANSDTISDVFSWTNNEKWKSFRGTMNPTRGQAGIVGQVEPALKNHRIEFLSPVDYCGPSFHHRITRKDATGWHARCKYLGGAKDVGIGRTEELRRPIDVDDVDWRDGVPDDLAIENVDENGNTAPDPSSSPVAAFAWGCLEPAELDEWVGKADVYAAFNAYLADLGRDPWDFDDRGTQIQFGNAIKDELEDVETKRRQGEQAWVRVQLSKRGENYLEDRRSPDVDDPDDENAHAD